MCTRHTRSQVQRQRFRWQASGSEEQPSESLPEEGPGGVCVFEWMCVWSRLSTHPSLEWRRCLRPGGRGRTRRASTPDGSSLRSREQQRYCREVAAETERITFMLLLAAVEHAIGKTCLFFISVAATPMHLRFLKKVRVPCQVSKWTPIMDPCPNRDEKLTLSPLWCIRPVYDRPQLSSSFPSRLQNVCLYLSRFTSDVPIPTIMSVP